MPRCASQHFGATDFRLGSFASVWLVDGMSAHPSTAAPKRTSLEVAFGPRTDMCTAQTASLFDHFVGDGEQRRWNCKVKRLGRREIDHEFVFRGRFSAPR